MQINRKARLGMALPDPNKERQREVKKLRGLDVVVCVCVYGRKRRLPVNDILLDKSGEGD